MLRIAFILVVFFTANTSLFAQTIVSGETFFDHDPGVGNGTPITIISPDSTITLSMSISTSGLVPGNHILYIRTRDDNGQWSLHEPKPINIVSEIVKAEYFFDQDPGVGNGISMPIVSSELQVSSSQTIPTTGLHAGEHILYIRTMNNTGSWSLQEARSFVIREKITSAEYFFDQDPGMANGIPLDLTDSELQISFNGFISTTGLLPGKHILFVRARDNSGKFGLFESRVFEIKSSIAKAEYFVDNDPGVGNGIPVSISASINEIIKTFIAPTSSLPSGKHSISIRTCDNGGSWGLSESRAFFVKEKMVAAEYFFDHDPGVGHGTSIPVVSSEDALTSTTTAASNCLSNGTHYLYIRTKDSHGRWSLFEPDTLTISGTAAEICNNIDDNCNGFIDEGFDLDNDGYTSCNGDCDDANALVHPGATELCGTPVDENCNGQINEGCITNSPNDFPGNASAVTYSSNMNFPNCYPINGTVANASDSPESGLSTGPDNWYKFVAQSSAASITLSSSGMDDAIGLYTKTGSVYMLVDFENAASGNFDYERMNVTGLIPGTTYYISVGAASGSGASFTLCIQHLLPSGCASVQPLNGFSLCGNFKAIARGAASNGVTYNFTFTGIGGGASGTTSVSGTNGLITLNNANLGLRYGGIYSVQVNVVYALLNSVGQSDNIIINGSASSANCSSVTMSAQPMIEVKSNQRCNAVLVRNSYLIGTPVAGNDLICGVINFTYKFSQVVSCFDGTSVSVFPTEYTTAGASPYLSLAVLPNLGNAGAWNVQIRPNFTYGPGIYGPVQRISVNNTAASTMLPDEQQASEKTTVIAPELALYPNPNKGDMVNLNITSIKSEFVFVRVFDAQGRTVYSNKFTASGSLNAVLIFEEPLTAGLYNVEYSVGDIVKSTRMIVVK